MKRLLRNKANFVVLEGFLSELLKEDVKIEELLESEGNKQHLKDKYNRMDLLAKNGQGELIIIEVQNSSEMDYFHRMLYGSSKAIVEHIDEGERYNKVKKLYSVNIVYFNFGQGTDYLYYGRTDFHGIHTGDILQLSPMQKKEFPRRMEPGDIFPEYYVLRVNEFDQLATTPLDEWIAFLKTGKIKDPVTAKGLAEAQKRLQFNLLSRSEQQEYLAEMESLRLEKSLLYTAHVEGREEGREEGLEEGREVGRTEERKRAEQEKRETARMLKQNGVTVEVIAQCTGLSAEEIKEL